MTVTRPGSSVSTIKRDLWQGLTTAFNGTARVCYAQPRQAADLRAANGEMVAVWFGTSFDVDYSVEIFAGGHFNFDEHYRLPVTVEVLEDPNDPAIADLTPDQRQLRIDERLDEALGTLLDWLADQANPSTTTGDDDEVQIFMATLAVDAGGARMSGFDPDVAHGYAAAQELAITVHARKVPTA